MYAAGKIPGSFFRREGSSGEKATLTARMIDRPIRPLFPKGWHYETQLVAIPMSVDQVHPYDILAMNGASAALAISPVPVAAHVGAVRIGKLDGDFVVNPDEEDLRGARPRPDRRRHRRGDPDGRGRRQRRHRGRDPRRPRHRPRRDQEALRRDGGAAAEGRQGEARGRGARRSTRACSTRSAPPTARLWSTRSPPRASSSATRRSTRSRTRSSAKYAPDDDDGEADDERKSPRSRPRSTRSRRTRSARRSPSTRSAPTAAPRTRSGRSSARSTSPRACTARRSSPAARPRSSPTSRSARPGWTCGSTRSACRPRRRFWHHYNFPPFSVGEAGFMRGPKRRDIGHGALAERALVATIPDEE